MAGVDQRDLCAVQINRAAFVETDPLDAIAGLIPADQVVNPHHRHVQLFGQRQRIAGVVAVAVGQQDMRRPRNRRRALVCGKHRVPRQPRIHQQHGVLNLDPETGVAKPDDLHGASFGCFYQRIGHPNRLSKPIAARATLQQRGGAGKRGAINLRSNPMSIDIDTARKVAKLARIRVEEANLPKLAEQLSGILGFMEQLNEVNVDGIEPMVSVTPMRLARRKDVVTDGNIQSQILKNAPDAREGFFAVPKVVE
jgi:aspartyl-tRNA(Asn)/glutamyl-tRNA(Gln) amidotransferase subunit C